MLWKVFSLVEFILVLSQNELHSRDTITLTLSAESDSTSYFEMKRNDNCFVGCVFLRESNLFQPCSVLRIHVTLFDSTTVCDLFIRVQELWPRKLYTFLEYIHPVKHICVSFQSNDAHIWWLFILPPCCAPTFKHSVWTMVRLNQWTI